MARVLVRMANAIKEAERRSGGQMSEPERVALIMREHDCDRANAEAILSDIFVDYDTRSILKR